MIAHTHSVRAERLGPAFDLIARYELGGAFFERNGIGAVGVPSSSSRSGSADRGRADVSEMVERAFARIRRDDVDPDAPPPLVFVSIPFDARRPAHVIRPARVVRRDRPGETWQLTIEPKEGDLARRYGRSGRAGTARPHAAFSDLQITPLPPPGTYERAVAEASRRIREGELRKVVLARTLEVSAGRALDAMQLLRRLRSVDPECYAFAFPTGPERTGVLVGASPELLVSRRGGEVRTEPLAGSAPRSGDPDEDRASAERLLDSAKDREEHAIVVDAVEETLAPLCRELGRDPEPVLLSTANVWHLATRFRGELRDPATDALSLAIALHPTPAVCGTPRSVAARMIRTFEPFERGFYGGPVGWVDASGDGEFAIALRCAELNGEVARLFSGAGIVADSEPAAELEETERKFRALLDALRWG